MRSNSVIFPEPRAAPTKPIATETANASVKYAKAILLSLAIGVLFDILIDVLIPDRSRVDWFALFRSRRLSVKTWSKINAVVAKSAKSTVKQVAFRNSCD
jgi:hypothetical protein